MIKSHLFKEGSLYLIGEILSKSIPFLLLPYLTRKLGTDGFGELSYYLVWLTLINIFISISQDGAVTRYYYFYGKRSISIIVKSGYLYSFLLTVLLLIVGLITNSNILVYLTITSLFQTFVSVQLALQQCQRKPIPYISIQIILALSNLGFTFLFLELLAIPDNVVDYRILAILMSNILTFSIIYYLFREKKLYRKKITIKNYKSGIRYIFIFGFPLIFHHLSFFAKGQIDRLFIYQEYTADDLGIYSAGVQLASVFPVLLMAINKAVIPHFYKNLKTNYEATADKVLINTKKSFILVFIPAVIAFLIPDTVYTFFLGNAYKEAKYFTTFYLVGYGLNIPYLILVNFLFYKGLNKLISISSIISSLIYLIFLPILGLISLYWIPLALITSNISLIIYLQLCVKKNLN